VVRVRFEGINTVRKHLSGGGVRIYYYHRATVLRLRASRARPSSSPAMVTLKKACVIVTQGKALMRWFAGTRFRSSSSKSWRPAPKRSTAGC
jgi:hypothetical protein